MQEFPTKLPRVIGLTGGIGAGKSTVARVLEAMGLPVWNADEAGRKAYASSSELRQWVGEHLGSSLLVFDASGNSVDVDRKALGDLAFQHPEILEELSARIHPLVAMAFEDWLTAQARRITPPLWVIREAAILFESGTDVGCHVTVTVEAPIQERIQRVMLRDGISESSVRSRMARQWSAEERMERASFVLHNGSQAPILPQIDQLLMDLNVDEL